MRSLCEPLATLALVACLSLTAFAQQPQVVNLNGKKLTGKVNAIAPGLFDMTAEDGTRWAISLQGRLGPLKLNAPPEITVRGKGHAGALSPGMSVAFFAKADKRNKLQGDVAALKIFSPTNETRYGMFATLPTARLDAPPEKATAGDKPAVELKDVEVFGKVVTIKGDALTVAIAGGALKAKLADNAEVVLETHDYSLVQPGDMVTAEVGYAEPKVGVATKVEFQLTRTLGGEPKKGK